MFASRCLSKKFCTFHLHFDVHIDFVGVFHMNLHYDCWSLFPLSNRKQFLLLYQSNCILVAFLTIVVFTPFSRFERVAIYPNYHLSDIYRKTVDLLWGKNKQTNIL